MTLNEAILNVLVNQFKKEMNPYAIELVKQAGYTIKKITGGYEVGNPTTARWLFIDKRGKLQTLNGCFAYRKGTRIVFDFVNYLNKPENKEWAQLRREQFWGYVSPTREKTDALRWAKTRVEYRKRDIEETKRKIANLQAQLEREVRDLVGAENNVDKVRKELGLK